MVRDTDGFPVERDDLHQLTRRLRALRADNDRAGIDADADWDPQCAEDDAMRRIATEDLALARRAVVKAWEAYIEAGRKFAARVEADLNGEHP